ncbi:Oidioi.mRNA.OKI2018_I69.PAR.g12835.t1.cds [Oikopleura dioica]|uniref:Oidioi.mRNA.OKI2018_I69.PAR.g12835.t1.cds n=1 Tax=Oikopleura dioica TaxID=34765 RepID=A0ABN7S7B6_OIKDI|nr:Oidioi.mRNA.OKI2018_I69.PAR.g12835.t1.cds [Oikopleura dioica]
MGSERFEKAFAKGDTDGSGTIDLAEAKALVKELGLDYTDAQIEEYFKKFDADNSGELDKEEAKALVKAIRPDIFE